MIRLVILLILIIIITMLYRGFKKPTDPTQPPTSQTKLQSVATPEGPPKVNQGGNATSSVEEPYNINDTIQSSLDNYMSQINGYNLNAPKQYLYPLIPGEQPITFPDPNGIYKSSLPIENLI